MKILYIPESFEGQQRVMANIQKYASEFRFLLPEF